MNLFRSGGNIGKPGRVDMLTLQEDISALRTDVGDLNSSVKALDERVTSSVQAVGTDVLEMKSSVQALGTDVLEMKSVLHSLVNAITDNRYPWPSPGPQGEQEAAAGVPDGTGAAAGAR